MNNAESHPGTEMVTLRDLFDLTEANFAGAATAAILATQTLAPLELQLLKEMKYFPWKSFAASLGRHALELFRTHLSDILLGAWQSIVCFPNMLTVASIHRANLLRFRCSNTR